MISVKSAIESCSFEFYYIIRSFVCIKTIDVFGEQKVFETITQRGKGLDPIELLKNLLFRQANRSDFSALEKSGYPLFVRWK